VQIVSGIDIFGLSAAPVVKQKIPDDQQQGCSNDYTQV
jgi:hypothetical protein